MNAVVLGANEFHPVNTIPVIESFRDSRTCLDCGPAGCPAGEVEDCFGNCAPASWVGDGICDDGSRQHDGVPIFLDCGQFAAEADDCAPPPSGDVTSLAADFQTVAGTNEGTATDTHLADDVHQSIQEGTTGGPPDARESLLEHVWTFDVAPGDRYVFSVEAHHSVNAEGDDFRFAYSPDGVAYTDMLTVTKTADDDTAQTFVLPGDAAGTVYVRVEDTDRTPGHGGRDRVFVDHMWILSEAFDVTDLLALLAAWGTSDPVHDLDGSGVVDVNDLLALLAAWG